VTQGWCGRRGRLAVFRGLATRLEDIQRANNVGLAVIVGIRNGARDTGLGREMDDAVHATDGLGDDFSVQDASFQDLHVKAGQVFPPSSAEVVQHAYLVAFVEE
jgi:hypothetical protein